MDKKVIRYGFIHPSVCCNCCDKVIPQGERYMTFYNKNQEKIWVCMSCLDSYQRQFG